VEAIQLRHPVTVPSSDSTTNDSYDVAAGTWIVVDGEGLQSYMPDEQFTSLYEVVPAPPKRGRPPKTVSGDVTMLPRRKRKRHKHAKAA